MKVLSRGLNDKGTTYIFDDGTIAMFSPITGWKYEKNGRAIPARYKNIRVEIENAIQEFNDSNVRAYVEEPKTDCTMREIFAAGFFGLVIGAILALTYVYRTGGL